MRTASALLGVLTLLTSQEFVAADLRTYSFSIVNESGIAGRYEQNRPVLLINDSPPFLCEARTGLVTTDIDEMAGRTKQTTRLTEMEHSCKNTVHLVALVGANAFNTRIATSEHLRKERHTQFDSLIRKSEAFRALQKEASDSRPYVPDDEYLKTILLRVLRVQFPDRDVYVGSYSRITGGHSNTNYLTIGNTVYMLGRFDLEKLKAFEVDGAPYVFVSGIGGAGWRFSSLSRITPTGPENVPLDYGFTLD